MSGEHPGTAGQETVRSVLHRWDRELADPPSFEALRHRITGSPSPLDALGWSAGRSVRVAATLAFMQIRVVPWTVLPVALVTMAMAVLAARFFGLTQGGAIADTGFATVALAGVAVTVTMGLSISRADAIALSTPLGPPVVVSARVTLVLALDALTGLAASVLVAAWGYTDSLAGLIAGWLIPAALVAAGATFASTWVAPWAGVITGFALLPVVAPVSGALSLFGVSGLLWTVLTPTGLCAAGVLLLAAAIASTRRAAVNGLRAA